MMVARSARMVFIIMRSLSEDEVLRLRMRSQLLAGAEGANVHEVVFRMCAIQSQDTRAARLAIRPRSRGLDAAAVTRACNEERSVVRTWAMRGTLHMLTAEDVGWVVNLLRPKPSAGRRRRLELGLDDELLSRALPLIWEIVHAEGPLTRAELVRRLAEKGVRIDPSGQAPAHLIGYAAWHELVCRGPDRDDEPTYVLLEDWVGKQPEPDPEEALAELTRRYVGAHGPAGVEDFAQWVGFSASEARCGFASISDELEMVRAAGQPAALLIRAQPDDLDGGKSCIRLLPQFDAYLLGYRSRELALPAKYAKRIQAGGGYIHPTVVVDGRVVGKWGQQRKRDQLVITVEAFEPLDRAVLPGLEAEAADVGRFLGVDATLAVEQP